MSESSPQRDAPAAEPEAVNAETARSEAIQSEASQSGATQSEAAEPEAAEPEFTNRAARRAKGKVSAKPEVFAKGQRPAGRGSVQSPRQYGNRRSG